ncbi:MAG: hypothetical protein R3F43_03015 [bacterium]
MRSRNTCSRLGVAGATSLTAQPAPMAAFTMAGAASGPFTFTR